MRTVRCLALLLTVMLLASCAIAETPADPIVIKIGETTVPLSEAQAYFDDLFGSYSAEAANYGASLSTEDIAYIRDMAFENLVMQQIIKIKAAELGLDVITDADKDEARQMAQKDYDEGIAGIAESYGASIEETIEMVTAYGITVDSLYESYVADLPISRLFNASVNDITVSDEAVAAEYNTYVENDKSSYENNVADYELYSAYYGEQIHYVPAGFRLVKHILLNLPEDIAKELSDLEADMSAISETIGQLEIELDAINNPESEETAAATETTDAKTEAAPRTAEEVQADLDAKTAEYEGVKATYEGARAKVLPALETTTNEIYAKLQAGETFDALITAYGTDPGMTANPNGYMVHKDSILWDTDFRDGAMALAKIGDVSTPVLTGFGVHIIQYADDAVSGAVPMSAETRATIYETLLGEEQNLAFYDMLTAWQEALGVEKHPELIVLPQVQESSVEEAPATDATAAPVG